LLGEIAAGNQAAIGELLPVVYSELRIIAERHLRMETPGHTLQATALVHEAYLKLIKQRNASWKDRAHFCSIASQVIRRVLLDHARRKRTLKRGGPAGRVTIDGVPADAPAPAIDLLALEEVLNELSRLDERQARIVELRFFGGLDMPEVAEVLGISVRTAQSDWALARAWLKVRLHGEPNG
jgi:RNA polymerase sigma factor (TIGR02999 family)